MDGADTHFGSSKPKACGISHVGLTATILGSLKRRKGGALPDLWQEVCSFKLDLILMSTNVVVSICKCVSTLEYIWYCQVLMSD